jgi:hypothetical protein
MNSFPDQFLGRKVVDPPPQDAAAKIVQELMRDFIVRSAVDPDYKGDQVIRVWHAAAMTGR